MKIVLLAGVAVAASAILCGCDAKASKTVDVDDPTQWICKKDATEAECPNSITEGSIPRVPEAEQLLHIVKRAAFTIRNPGVAGAKPQFWPATSEWLPPFLHAPLTWKPNHKLMPYADCPNDQKAAAFKVDPDDLGNMFSNFEAVIELHLVKNGSAAQTHYFRIYPTDPATNGNKTDYCLTISGHGSGYHDGAVHSDNDG